MLLSDAVSRGDAMYLVRTNALLTSPTLLMWMRRALEALSRHSKQNTASLFTTNEKKEINKSAIANQFPTIQIVYTKTELRGKTKK